MKHLRDMRIFVITGAGISAESGIPTFRGPGGYWRKLDPAKLATEAAFKANPQLVWDWYRERREGIRRVQPNAAHEAVTELAARAGEFLLVTQNVDDLHARADRRGERLPREKLVQIHGDIFVSRCSECSFLEREADRDAVGGGVPPCPRCDAALRPGVVWFGESLPAGEVQRVEDFLGAGPCDLTLVIGTTAQFGYLIDWALAAKGRTGRLIEVNPDDSGMSPYATERVREPAAAALPRLVAQLSL